MNLLHLKLVMIQAPPQLVDNSAELLRKLSGGEFIELATSITSENTNLLVCLVCIDERPEIVRNFLGRLNGLHVFVAPLNGWASLGFPEVSKFLLKEKTG